MRFNLNDKKSFTTPRWIQSYIIWIFNRKLKTRLCGDRTEFRFYNSIFKSCNYILHSMISMLMCNDEFEYFEMYFSEVILS